MVILTSLVALLLCHAQEPEASPVHFELEVHRIITEQLLESGAEVYAGETLLLVLQWDMELEFFDHQILPQWRFPLDFQAELTTPWLEDSAAWRKLGADLSGTTSLVLDREQGFVLRLADSGDGRAHFRLQQEIQVQDRSWGIVPAQLRVVWATEFEEDMIRGLVPTNRRSETFTTTAFQINVLPIPVAGRPQDFFGAVGDFEMTLTELPNTSPRQFQLSYLGKGKLAVEQLPKLDQFLDFPLQGQRFEVVAGGIVQHLETESAAAFPRLDWSFFNPSEQAFVTRNIGSEPILAGADSPELPWPWLGGAILLLFGLYWVRGGKGMGQKASSGATPSPVAKVQEAQDLIDDLARLLSCKREEIYMDDLERLLQAKKIPADLTQDLVDVTQRIVQARYAEHGTAPEEEVLNALRERLQALC